MVTQRRHWTAETAATSTRTRRIMQRDARLLYRGRGKYFMHQNKHELHFCARQSWHKLCVVTGTDNMSVGRETGDGLCFHSHLDCDKWHSGKMKNTGIWGNVGWGGYHRMMVVTSDQGGSGMAGCDQGCRAWTWDEQSRAWRGREAAIARAGRCWLANVWCRPCHELVTWPQCDGGWPGTEQCHTRTARAGPGDTASTAERGPGLWHSVRDTPGTGRHRDTSVTVWHSDVTRNTDNITLESFATRTDVLRVL